MADWVNQGGPEDYYGGGPLFVAFSGCRDRRVPAAAIGARIEPGSVVLVGDCPTGVDRCVRSYCSNEGIRCIVFRANWDRYDRRAGPLRNARMVDVADSLVAFWDGVSPGTRSAIAAARRLLVPCEVVILDEGDGVDHINVYSKGETWLGRQLSNFARTPFEHPEHGRFESIEGFWYWLGCRDDSLRKAYGYRAKQLGRELGAPDWLEEQEFQDQIRTALRCKLEQNPKIAQALIKCALPLDHYYKYGDKVVRPQQGRWILDYLDGYLAG